ncbi:MAG: hypothetical protein H0W65_11720 [Sphingomonas sp.]|uniref:hypothetical protein n=1 Tax=Sphingomonas sp. TaxID=28214 RepID=UPI0017FCA998|nr:hypothetical protein [Sphingomonas sp.]MBA3668366.1 hypothetical protein [Sphingomonas sp.]
MPQAATPLVERIARVLAGYDRSANADGSDSHAARDVDSAWRDYQGHALAILRELREPDPVMAAAGDPGIWSAMVHAALDSAENRAK